MESFEKNISQENEKETALALFVEYKNENEDYKNEIKEILNTNPTLKQAVYSYGGTDMFTEFDITTWGPFGGAAQHWSLDASDRIIREPKNSLITGVYNEILSEWRNRKNQIIAELKAFTGDEKSGFDLVQKLHKELILKQLNDNDHPLMQHSFQQ